jgi:hypothetical protein
MQLLAGQQLGQVGQYGQNLMTKGMDAAQNMRQFLMPYVTKGNVGQDALTTGSLRGGVKSDRQIDPRWNAAEKAGFGSPEEQSYYAANPDLFEKMYGKYRGGASSTGYDPNYNPYGNTYGNYGNTYGNHGNNGNQTWRNNTWGGY